MQNDTLTFGSLFAGIGGFDLGFERAGMRCAWQVENDEYANRVLAKHWPQVRRWDDVRTFPPNTRDPWKVDLICAGFPCQDVSNAAQQSGGGIDGERTGLWREAVRVIRGMEPRWIVLENVAAIVNRGLARILGELASCRYDLEWDCLPAAAFGAPFPRDRVFIIGCRTDSWLRFEKNREQERETAPLKWSASKQARSHHRLRPRRRWLPLAGIRPCEFRAQWSAEPGVDRVANGVPRGVDRHRGLGNGVVPQVAELIGRRILQYELNQI